MPYSPSNAAWSGVNKVTKKASKVAQEALGWIAPVGKPMKAAKAGKAVSKALKAAKKTKPLANPKSAVKVLPRKTAPKSGLEGRGAKLTKSQRSVRAQDYKFDKQLDGYYKDIDRRAGTHPDDMPRNPRGDGKKNLRKDKAISKEAKPVVKINSQRNLKKK
jgi:hypothetical protein